MNIPFMFSNELEYLYWVDDGEIVRNLKMAFPKAGERPDCIYSMDVSSLMGKLITLKTRAADPHVLESITLSDVPEENLSRDIYKEECRPQFHFSALRGKTGDPNGLHVANGVYHLFFQFNPIWRKQGGVAIEGMHWGHAVSSDLMHWKELSPALYPFDKWNKCFSGSGVVDFADLLGMNRGDDRTQVVFFSSGDQWMATSTDDGCTWQRRKDPVLKRTEEDRRARRAPRDPKVFYYAPAKHWVMVLFNGGARDRAESSSFEIYNSKNLTDWVKTDEQFGFYECPEFFELPVAGHPEKKLWVMYGGHIAAGDTEGVYKLKRSYYRIGMFDGRRFVPLTDFVKGCAGPHCYAEQVFNHDPKGRCVMLGNLAAGDDWTETDFSPGMTVPMELSLRERAGEIKLHYYPVEEVKTLRFNELAGTDLGVQEANSLSSKMKGELFDIEMEIEPGVKLFSVEVKGARLDYDPETQTLISPDWASGRVVSPLALSGGAIKIRILADVHSLEVFANDGEVACIAVGKYRKGCPGLKFCGDGTVRSLRVYQIRSALPSTGLSFYPGFKMSEAFQRQMILKCLKNN
jgi:sucrose-6-phosphate hydrolase SacC (GH32 family)